MVSLNTSLLHKLLICLLDDFKKKRKTWIGNGIEKKFRTFPAFAQIFGIT